MRGNLDTKNHSSSYFNTNKAIKAKPNSLSIATNTDYKNSYKQLSHLSLVESKAPEQMAKPRTKIQLKVSLKESQRESLKDNPKESQKDSPIKISKKATSTEVKPARKKTAKKPPKQEPEHENNELLIELQDKIGYQFSNVSYLVEALTHPSVKGKNSKHTCYQRLEFLGDKVLGLVVASYLFSKNKLESEGEISRRHSRIVCGTSCAKVAKQLKLSKYIKLSKSQERDGGAENPKILENVLEAIIGGIYSDSNLKEAKSFIINTFCEILQTESTGTAIKDPKTLLQEWTQKNKYDLPSYIVVEREIEKGSKFFEATVKVSGLRDAIGAGRTIKVAERTAAERIVSENKLF